MQRNRRTSIIVVGGALAVASVSYGLGTQTDDGTAVADANPDRGGRAGLRFEHRVPPGFANLAADLGVSSAKLGAALRDFHEQEHGDHRDEFASRLADALGISADRVRTALRTDSRRDHVMPAPAPGPGGPGPHVRPFFPIGQLAAALDVSRADLRKALDEVRPDRGDFEEHQKALAEFVAERFDLDVDEVTETLGDLPRPAPPPHGPPR